MVPYLCEPVSARASLGVANWRKTQRTCSGLRRPAPDTFQRHRLRTRRTGPWTKYTNSKQRCPHSVISYPVKFLLCWYQRLSKEFGKCVWVCVGGCGIGMERVWGGYYANLAHQAGSIRVARQPEPTGCSGWLTGTSGVDWNVIKMHIIPSAWPDRNGKTQKCNRATSSISSTVFSTGVLNIAMPTQQN